ncbi:MAG: hypothetical protein WEB89_01245 [Balneolales bacterium]
MMPQSLYRIHLHLVFSTRDRIPYLKEKAGMADQEKHHQKKSFKQEYRERLEKHNIDYDERVPACVALTGLGCMVNC